MLEASSPSDYSLTSYGHCYQTLIQAAFSKASIRSQEFDSFINYLSELAYFIYQGGAESISTLAISDFQDKYSREYLIESHDHVLNKIEQSGLLVRDGSRLYFGYKYIFYFYVARYLSDHLNTISCKEEIKSLCRLIHLEKSANILIFLLHHTKDEDIVGELIANSEKIFEDGDPAALDVKDTSHIARYIADIPELMLEEKDIEAERKKRLRSKDIAEEQGSDESEDDTVDGDDGFLADVNRSFRSIQIIGQILRNRKGSLNKKQLQSLAEAADGAGLRFLKFFLALTERSEHTILKLITEALKQRDDLSDDDIADEARKMFLLICYGTSYAVVKHLADSLGSRELLSIFESIKNERRDQPVYSIIFVAIKLEFTKEIPRDDVELLYMELDGNLIARRLLQEIVVRHLHLNHVSYRDQQWISEKLAIPLATQKILQRKDRKKID